MLNTYGTRQCRSPTLANDDAMIAAVDKHTLSQPRVLELRYFMTTNRVLTTTSGECICFQTVKIVHIFVTDVVYVTSHA
jgi:hypothetical protein